MEIAFLPFFQKIEEELPPSLSATSVIIPERKRKWEINAALPLLPSLSLASMRR